MPWITIKRFTVETLGRAFGTRAFVTALDAAIPEAQLQAEESLTVWAHENGVEFSEYVSELHVLKEHYGYWVPRLAAYSALVAVHSLVEAELFAAGDHFNGAGGKGQVKRGKRRGLERARSFLKRTSGVDIGADEAWPDLLRLEDLRNIVVHRGGSVDIEEKKKLDGIERAYVGELWIAKRSDFHTPCLHVSPTMCARFADAAEGLIRRLVSQLDNRV